MALTPHMIKLLHVARSKVGMTDEIYRAMLGGYGATSSKDRCLQPAHYFEMMQKFKGMGFKPAAKPTAGRASPGQRAKIAAMEHALGWASEPKRLRAFLEKWYHVSAPQFLTPRQAWRAIESLKAILAKQPAGAAHA